MSHFNPLNDIIWDVDPLPYYFYPQPSEDQVKFFTWFRARAVDMALTKDISAFGVFFLGLYLEAFLLLDKFIYSVYT